MKAKVLLFIVFILAAAISNAQPAIEWRKSLGGTADDYANSIQQTNDGGYIFAGQSNSNNGDVTGNHGGSDYWIVKINSTGAIEWQKSLGGSGDDWANSIQQTTDGGYIFAGASMSNDGDVTGNHGLSDYWIVKLNSAGDIEWQKALGGKADDLAYSVQQTTDGGYIVVGSSYSNDGDVTGHHGDAGEEGFPDYWIVKLNSSGDIEWQKSLGGSDWDKAFSIQQTTDGGYIVAGASYSQDGDVTGNHGGSDYWIVKLYSEGNIEWQKSMGGTISDDARLIQQTIDGGYIVAGESYSNDGDVTGKHGGYDYWIVKLDSGGSIEWQKTLGGTSLDGAVSIQQSIDSSYIVSGWSGSNDNDVTGNQGGYDYWIVKLDSGGSIEWQKTLGGIEDDFANSVQQTTDGGYIVAGSSYSNDGDVTGHHGTNKYFDIWIVKLSPYNGIEEEQVNENSINIYPNPVNSLIVVSCPLIENKNANIRVYDLMGREQLIITRDNKLKSKELVSSISMVHAREKLNIFS